MRDLLSSWESGCVPETASRHVSNFTRCISRLSGKPTSWSLVNNDHLQVCGKGLRWKWPTVLSMQRYMSGSNSNNMTYDESGYFGGQEGFGMDSTDAGGHEQLQQTGRNFMGANFTGTPLDRVLDPSAAFPRLGDLPSGMESAVENNLAGTFTGDLNASAYEVGEDHSQLLQDMLQQQSQAHTSHDSHSQGGAGANSAGANWEDSLHVLQGMLLLQQQQAQQIYNQSQAAEQVYNSHAYPGHGSSGSGAGGQGASAAAAYNHMKFPGESELLSLLQLPRSVAQLPSSGFTSSSARGKGPLQYSTSTNIISGPVNGTGSEFFESRLGQLQGHGGALHGSPLLHNSGAAQNAASFFHSLPRPGDGAATAGASNSSLLNRQAPILVDLDQDRDDLDGKAASSPFGLKRDHHSNIGMGKGEPRGVNHFATERQRREFLNEKYQTLRSLVPNPTKADRASIVADAIEYVKELKRTVQELQLLMQEKRRAAGGLIGRKRSHRSMDQADGLNGAGGPDMSGSASNSAQTTTFIQKGNDGAYAVDGSQLRSSWLQRTSQNGTQVDVRIVHDEVTIKLTQRRRKNCLLDVFGVLHELHLDLLQASGASIGEHDVFLFNTKILEGSSTFAGYIAAKMLDAVDHRPLM